jgi:hypothetical protein
VSFEVHNRTFSWFDKHLSPVNQDKHFLEEVVSNQLFMATPWLQNIYMWRKPWHVD